MNIHTHVWNHVLWSCRLFEQLSGFPTCLHSTIFPIYLSTHALTHPPHLGHASMPLCGGNDQAAAAVIVGEHEQVFAAGLDQHLRPCRFLVSDYGESM